MDNKESNARSFYRIIDPRWIALLFVALFIIVAVQAYLIFDLKKDVAQMSYSADQSSGVQQALQDLFANDDQFGSMRNPSTWKPFKGMERVQEQMDSIFDQAFGWFNNSPQFQGWMQPDSLGMKMDIAEDESKYVISVDIPGAEASKINVNLKEQQLTISGTRVELNEENDDSNTSSYIRRERHLGEFSRTITLDQPVISTKMTTEFENGVLTITISKDRRFEG